MKEIVIDSNDGSLIEKNYSVEDIENVEKDREAMEIAAQKAALEDAERIANKKAILAKLGITEEEAKLLLS